MLHMGPLYQVIHRVYPAKHVHSVDADTRVLREISARQYGSGQPGGGTPPGACSVVVLALTGVAQDVNYLANVRVSAARTVLELALKGVELEDLAVRVEELESQVAGV